MPIEIGRDEVQRLVHEGSQLADVRPEAEFGNEHISGAIHLPLKALEASMGSELKRDAPLIVY